MPELGALVIPIPSESNFRIRRSVEFEVIAKNHKVVAGFIALDCREPGSFVVALSDESSGSDDLTREEI